MKFLQRLVETKLSELLGREVKFESMKVSLLGGSIEASGLSVAADRPGEMPLLTARQIRAEISVARALKKEIAIKSMEIAGSVLSVIRRSDGSTNLPQISRRPPGGGRMAGEMDQETPAGAPPEATPRAVFGGASGGEESRAWDFEAADISLREGAASLEWQTGAGGAYRASVEGVAGHVGMTGGAVTVSLQAKSLGRRDVAVEIGPARVTGRLDGVMSLVHPIPDSAGITLSIGPLGRDFRVELQSKAPAAYEVQAEAAGTLDIGVVLSLLPRGLLMNPRLGFVNLLLPQAGGSVEVLARGQFTPREGVRIAEMNVSAKDLTLPIEPV